MQHASPVRDAGRSVGTAIPDPVYPCLLWRLRASRPPLSLRSIGYFLRCSWKVTSHWFSCDVLLYCPMIVLSRLPHLFTRLSTEHPIFAPECSTTSPKVETPIGTTTVPAPWDVDPSSFSSLFQYCALCDCSPCN